jgi:NDP-sugar pyrophosphorylase family protein
VGSTDGNGARKMHVIILAAGKSKRFQEEGYTIPKPCLNIEWRGRIAWMVYHVFFTIPVEFSLKTIAIPPGITNDPEDIHFSVSDTKGPADTAMQVINEVEPDSCLILDSDILNFTNDLRVLTNTTDIGVLVNSSANPAFSYVDSLNNFTSIREKQRISPYAVRGAYFVSKKAMKKFRFALENVVKSQREPFISHAIDLMDCTKYALETTYDPIDWGTPRDIKLSGAKIVTEKGEENVRDPRS